MDGSRFPVSACVPQWLRGDRGSIGLFVAHRADIRMYFQNFAQLPECAFGPGCPLSLTKGPLQPCYPVETFHLAGAHRIEAVIQIRRVDVDDQGYPFAETSFIMRRMIGSGSSRRYVPPITRTPMPPGRL
jgi:hypothetical protein